MCFSVLMFFSFVISQFLETSSCLKTSRSYFIPNQINCHFYHSCMCAARLCGHVRFPWQLCTCWMSTMEVLLSEASSMSLSKPCLLSLHGFSVFVFNSVFFFSLSASSLPGWILILFSVSVCFCFSQMKLWCTYGTQSSPCAGNLRGATHPQTHTSTHSSDALYSAAVSYCLL